MHIESDPKTGEVRQVLHPREARQGPLGRPVLYVLVASLVLALIAWGAVSYYNPSAPVTSMLSVTATPA